MNSRSFGALALLLAVAPSACSLTNDLSGYSGGRASDATVSDSETVDTATPPADTNEPEDTSTVEEDSGADTSSPTDSGSDIPIDASADSARVDAADAGSGDAAMDAVVTDVGADTRDAATPGADANETGGTVADASSDAAAGCHVVINEVATRGAGSAFDEMIELYNPCETAIPIAGWKLVYRSDSGTTETIFVSSIAVGASVPAKGFYLFTYQTASFTSSYAAAADATYGSGMADAGGVGIRDTTGALIDSVTWGTSVAAGHPFTEGTSAASPGTATIGSIARTPNGKDTNDNSVDFVKGTPTPKS